MNLKSMLRMRFFVFAIIVLFVATSCELDPSTNGESNLIEGPGETTPVAPQPTTAIEKEPYLMQLGTRDNGSKLFGAMADTSFIFSYYSFSEVYDSILFEGNLYLYQYNGNTSRIYKNAEVIFDLYRYRPMNESRFFINNDKLSFGPIVLYCTGGSCSGCEVCESGEVESGFVLYYLSDRELIRLPNYSSTSSLVAMDSDDRDIVLLYQNGYSYTFVSYHSLFEHIDASGIVVDFKLEDGEITYWGTDIVDPESGISAGVVQRGENQEIYTQDSRYISLVADAKVFKDQLIVIEINSPVEKGSEGFDYLLRVYKDGSLIKELECNSFSAMMPKIVVEKENFYICNLYSTEGKGAVLKNGVSFENLFAEGDLVQSVCEISERDYDFFKIVF